MKEGQNGNALLQEESMVEAYDKWRRWADEKVFKFITLLAVYNGDSNMRTLIMIGRIYE